MIRIPLDKIVSKLAGIGVPALVLIVAMSVSGFAGAAAFTTALAALGGPLGMFGGAVLLGILVLLSKAMAEYGFEAIFSAVIRELIKQGKTQEELVSTVDGYPISKDLKLKIVDEIRRYFDKQAQEVIPRD